MSLVPTHVEKAMLKECNYDYTQAIQDEATEMKEDIKLVWVIHYTSAAVDNCANIAKMRH